MTVVSTYGKKSYFGEISFITGLGRKASARAKEVSRLYKLTREDFLEVVKENQEDFEKLCMFRDRVIFYNDYKCLKIKCFICGCMDHLSN